MNARALLAILALAAVVLFAGLFSGCQTLGRLDTEARLPVTYATLSLIGDSPERAQAVLDLALDIAARLDDREVTLDLLDNALRSQIPWAALTPANRLLADALLAEIAAKLDRRIGAETLSPEHRERVGAIVGYVIRAAELGGAHR